MTELLSVWDAIRQPRILVVGDIILDSYTWGNADRVSPEAPVLVLKAEAHEARLGGAANVANLLQALGAEVTLAGVIGNDSNGAVVKRLLIEARIDDTLVFCDASRPTTNKLRLMGRSEGKRPHHVLRVDEELTHLLAPKIQQVLGEQISDRMSQFDAVLISDYAKGFCRSNKPRTVCRGPYQDAQAVLDGAQRSSEVGQRENQRSASIENWVEPTAETADETVLLSTVIQASRERGIPVLIDPARIASGECYSGATLLKPNRIEAELLTGLSIKTPQAAMRAADALCDQLGLEAVAITLDRDGMVLSRAGSPGEFVPTPPRTVFDITGAGDMVLAVFGLVIASTGKALSLTRSSIILHAARLANLASGLEVERMGVCPVTRDEIRAAIIESDSPQPSKLISNVAAQQIADEYRERGKRIVFTNGCFDLLHVGHLTCLKEAAAMGDVLFVAINSDEGVRQLKGPDRPVSGQAERAAILAGLECVDHVLVFDEPTPQELLHRIRPDVLVKGGTTADVVGREFVESYGGKVSLTGFVHGISTTHVIEKARRVEDR